MTHWRLKLGAKLLLSRIPCSQWLWRQLGIFRLGKMETADYAFKIFNLHENMCFPDGLPSDFTILELGCGDSIASALIAAGKNVRKTWLVDTGSYASQDINLYKKMARDLRSETPVPDISQVQNFEDLLKLCRASYMTKGLESLRSIPSESVDYIWSHSVLEHVRKHEFADTMKELHRILKKTGTMSHNVNLKDHLGEALNNLRFSEALWESEFFAGAGFYTNRIRYTQMLNLIQEAGFTVRFADSGCWNKIPTPREKLAKPFRDLPESDLLIRTCHFILAA